MTAALGGFMLMNAYRSSSDEDAPRARYDAPTPAQIARQRLMREKNRALSAAPLIREPPQPGATLRGVPQPGNMADRVLSAQRAKPRSGIDGGTQSLRYHIFAELDIVRTPRQGARLMDALTAAGVVAIGADGCRQVSSLEKLDDVLRTFALPEGLCGGIPLDDLQKQSVRDVLTQFQREALLRAKLGSKARALYRTLQSKVDLLAQDMAERASSGAPSAATYRARYKNNAELQKMRRDYEVICEELEAWPSQRSGSNAVEPLP